VFILFKVSSTDFIIFFSSTGQPGTPGLSGSPSYPKPSYPVAPGNF